MTAQPSAISKKLLEKVKADFSLDWSGIHGVRHWSRVRVNGLKLCEHIDADRTVVELFAFLHDIQRRHDGFDRMHGNRAADYIDTLAGEYFKLNQHQLQQLKFACSHHSNSGVTSDDPTIQVCWDADRLDLGRVQIRPHTDYLQTWKARETLFLDQAYLRSMRN